MAADNGNIVFEYNAYEQCWQAHCWEYDVIASGGQSSGGLNAGSEDATINAGSADATINEGSYA